MGEKIHCSVLEVTRRTAFRLLDLPMEWKPRAHGSPWQSHMGQSHMSKTLHIEAPNQKKSGDLFVRKDPKFLNMKFCINS